MSHQFLLDTNIISDLIRNPTGRIYHCLNARCLDLTLITAHIREFSRVPNLRIENWLDVERDPGARR